MNADAMNDGADAGASQPEQGDAAAPGPSSWNLPNTLTVGRLVMVPVFVVIAWVGFDRGSDAAWQTWAAVVFGAAAITIWSTVSWLVAPTRSRLSARSSTRSPTRC